MRASDTQQVRRERDTAATQDRHHVSRGPLIERSNLFSNITQCFYIWSRLPNGRKSPQKTPQNDDNSKRPALTRVSWRTPAMFCRWRSVRRASAADKRRRENPVSLVWLVRWKLQRGKPSVAYVRIQRQYCVLSKDGHRRILTRVLDLCLTSWPQNKRVLGLIVKHFYVKFSDSSCIGIYRATLC